MPGSPSSSISSTSSGKKLTADKGYLLDNRAFMPFLPKAGDAMSNQGGTE
jgi:hypothetical protein